VAIDINSVINMLMAIWLPFIRILAFIQFSPIVDQRIFPIKVKALLALLLAIIIAPMLEHNVIVKELLSLQNLILIGEQILWGFVFGSMLQMIFTALQMAGHILSFNMGLGMAVMNDPGSGASTTVIAQFIFVFAALLFFSMDGHLLLVSILYKGFIYWPIGEALNAMSFKTLALNLGWVISSATLLALPTTFIMLIVQVAFGLLNRVSPSLNLFSLGFPVSMLFGIFCLLLLMTVIPEHYINLTNIILDRFDALRNYHG
jgi:flagellar biosynthetic protein FliR